MKHISGSDTHVGMDFVMQYLFNNKNYWPILEGLLYCVLDRPVKIKSILSGETNKEHRNLKLARIDITIETVDDLIIVMELQKEQQSHFLQRVIFGVSRTLLDHLKSGESYKLLKRILSINILFFQLFKGMTDYVYDLRAKLIGRNDGSEYDVSVSGLMDTKLENQKVSPAYHFILVKQMNEEDSTILDPLQQWIYFFRYSKLLPYFDAPGLIEAGKRFARLNLSVEEQYMLTQHEMDLASHRDTINTMASKRLEAERRKTEVERRKAEVEHDKVRSMAKAFLLSGQSFDYVLKISSLPEKELKEIQSELV